MHAHTCSTNRKLMKITKKTKTGTRGMEKVTKSVKLVERILRTSRFYICNIRVKE